MVQGRAGAGGHRPRLGCAAARGCSLGRAGLLAGLGWAGDHPPPPPALGTAVPTAQQCPRSRNPPSLPTYPFSTSLTPHPDPGPTPHSPLHPCRHARGRRRVQAGQVRQDRDALPGGRRRSLRGDLHQEGLLPTLRLQGARARVCVGGCGVCLDGCGRGMRGRAGSRRACLLPLVLAFWAGGEPANQPTNHPSASNQPTHPKPLPQPTHAGRRARSWSCSTRPATPASSTPSAASSRPPRATTSCRRSGSASWAGARCGAGEEGERWGWRPGRQGRRATAGGCPQPASGPRAGPHSRRSLRRGRPTLGGSPASQPASQHTKCRAACAMLKA